MYVCVREVDKGWVQVQGGSSNGKGSWIHENQFANSNN